MWRLDGQSKRRRPTQLLDQVALRSDGGAGLSERVAGLRADLPPRGFGQEFGVVEVASSLIVDGGADAIEVVAEPNECSANDCR